MAALADSALQQKSKINGLYDCDFYSRACSRPKRSNAAAAPPLIRTTLSSRSETWPHR